jgi:tetratricopeptide (TPR) repeat protein
MTMKPTAILTFLVAGAIFAPQAMASSAQRNSVADKAAAAASAAEQRDTDETLARTYLATKRFAESAAVFEKLSKSNPRDPKYANYTGIAYMQDGNLKMARTWFQRATKIEPRFADAYNNLGATWYAEKNFKRALQFYQRAVMLQPGVAGYHTNVGYAYFSMKMPIEAEEAFKRALLMDPLIFQQNGRTGSVLQDRSVQDKGLFAYTMAQSYAEANDSATCAAYLRRSLDEGYKDIAKVYLDPVFAPILAEPNIQAVLALIPQPNTAAAAGAAAQ